ncbi:hypothetical protein QYE76_070754 [Lolium multiflorum]|uniref:Uncharacterized protein n=1 Tax=Lolium multiflorum TaxID=4521 RepID=A0AAD8SJJ2_LOLMU|nr:hypothetical protein QYE76_070754 [Lolium multiflorum]
MFPTPPGRRAAVHRESTFASLPPTRLPLLLKSQVDSRPYLVNLTATFFAPQRYGRPLLLKSQADSRPYLVNLLVGSTDW